MVAEIVDSELIAHLFDAVWVAEKYPALGTENDGLWTIYRTRGAGFLREHKFAPPSLVVYRVCPFPMSRLRQVG